MRSKMVKDADNRWVLQYPATADPNVVGVECTLPLGWEPTAFAVARLEDALINTVEPRDFDRVPVSEVFHLAANIATDVLLKLAQVQAALAKSQSEASEARQRLLANETQATLEREALVRSIFRYAEEEVRKLHPTARVELPRLAEELTQRLYQELDEMKPRPDVASKMVESIKKVGQSWQQR